jgi:hypothetical protein
MQKINLKDFLTFLTTDKLSIVIKKSQENLDENADPANLPIMEKLIR